MIDLRITFDDKQVRRMLTDVQQRRLPAAIVRTLNLTAQQTRVEAGKEIRRRFGDALGLSAAGAKRAMRVIKAKLRLPVATIIVTGKALNVIDYGGRQTATGVSAAPMGKRRIFIGGFIARMPSGRRLAVRRTMESRTKEGRDSKGRLKKNRLPVRDIWGPALPKVFLTKDLLRHMRATADARWRVNFDRELRRILHRL